MNKNQSVFIVLILCLQTVFNCIVSVIGQYIYQYYLEIYSNHSKNGTNFYHWKEEHEEAQCLMANQTEGGVNSSAEIWAQEQSADLSYRMTLWRAFPVVISTYLFGVYARAINRRLALCVSIFGNALHALIYQAIIYRYLSGNWWYISPLIAGLSGGTNVISIVVNLVIAETSSENERSTRFVRLSGMTTALGAVLTFAIGYYIQWRGFTDLFWIALATELFSIIAVIVFYQSTPHRSSSSSFDERRSLLSPPSEQTDSTRSQCGTVSSVFSCQNARSRTRSLNITLILLAYTFYYIAASSLSPLIWYLLSAPFCWVSIDLGNFWAISSISTAILSVVGMKVFTYFGANDVLICCFGLVCFLGYCLLIALAKYSWQLYLSLLISPFSNYQSTLTFSMVSKWLDVNQRNQIFALITLINTIIWDFGSAISNWIYARTVTNQKNFTFLFASGLTIVPFILNLCLLMIQSRIPVEQQSTGTESDAGINETTETI